MPFCTCIRLPASLDDGALRAVEHLVGNLFAAMGGQAVQKECVLPRSLHQRGIDLIRAKSRRRISFSASWPMLAHTSV